MAARRKLGSKKTLKKRRGRVRAEEVRKRRKSSARQVANERRVAAPKKKRRAPPKRRAAPKKRPAVKKRRAAPRQTLKKVPKKKRRAPPSRPAPKKKRRVPSPRPALKKKRRAPPRPALKKKRRAPPPPPKKKRRRVVRPRPAVEGAVTRAYRAFLEAPTPSNAARRQTYDERRDALVRALENAGRSPASIRAILGWIKRRKNVVRERVARIRIALLGTELLDATTREGWYTLRAMVSERDERFLRFLRAAEAEGLEHDEAVDEWFSPKVRGAR